MSTSFDLNAMMAKIQGLLAKADSTEFPDEATALRAKAEEIMRKYRIEEEQLIAVDQVAIAPEVHRLWLGSSRDVTRATRTKPGVSFYQQWYDLAYAAGTHAGAMVSYRWGRNEATNEHGIFAVFVGYAGDLRLAEMIYSNARLIFGERVEPKPDPSLSDQINCYRLRSAGIARPRISMLLWGTDQKAVKVSDLYKRECALRGETPALDGRGLDAGLYRDQYAAAFVSEFRTRLRLARDAADSIGGSLVLAGRAERIQEAFWTEFPELRPQPATDVATRETAPATTKTRRRKDYWETAAGRREMARHYSDLAATARGAGRAAAAEVPLDRASDARRVNEGSAPRTARGSLEG